MNSYWDIDTLIKIKEYINPHRNILEIGSHSGTSTIIYASYLDNKNKVICYEPQKNQFKLLQKNIEQNNLISKTELYNNAVFCDNRELYLNDIDLDGGGGNIEKRYNAENKLECNFGGLSLGKNGEMVTSITIDSKNHSNIGFIHCDAQGSENHIFSKSKNLIKYNRPVILYENNKKYAKYLYDKVCNSYPEYNIESKFDIEKYCMEELKYSKIIYNFNNSQDDLLIP